MKNFLKIFTGKENSLLSFRESFNRSAWSSVYVSQKIDTVNCLTTVFLGCTEYHTKCRIREIHLLNSTLLTVANVRRVMTCNKYFVIIWNKCFQQTHFRNYVICNTWMSLVQYFVSFSAALSDIQTTSCKSKRSEAEKLSVHAPVKTPTILR